MLTLKVYITRYKAPNGILATLLFIDFINFFYDYVISKIENWARKTLHNRNDMFPLVNSAYLKIRSLRNKFLKAKNLYLIKKRNKSEIPK